MQRIGKVDPCKAPISWLFILWACLIYVPVYAQSICGCPDCPKSINDLSTTLVNLQVQGAASPLLGTNGQGLCEVRLSFAHPFIGDLQVVLEAPSGQRVQLIGPSGCFGCERTDGTRWDVRFVPCSQTAQPDAGMPARWDNAARWGIKVGSPYSGSYYPQRGCLDTLRGPVNGTWRLHFTDGGATDRGSLIGYSLRFCDPMGAACSDCQAEAGNLLEPDVTACAGSSKLRLRPRPVYAPSQQAPTSAAYGYTYVLANAQGLLIAYDSLADFRSLQTGKYTVCGLSYARRDINLLPRPNGVLTVTALRAQLQSAMPPFCGDITDNCIELTISAGVSTAADILGGGSVVRCTADTSYFFLPSASGIRSFQWTVDGPGQIIFGQGTDGIEVRWGVVNTPTVATVCVRLETECDTLPKRCTSVTVSTTPTKPVAILGATVVCSGVQMEYIVPPVPGATDYKWTATESEIVNFTKRDSLVLVWRSNLTAQARICIQALNVCGASDSLCLGIRPAPLVTTRPNLVNLQGGSRFCKGARSTYTIAGTVSNSERFQWQILGGVILQGQGTSNVEVQWKDTVSARICVAGANRCGIGPFSCLPIQLDNPPAVSVGLDKVKCGLTDTLITSGRQGRWDWISGPGRVTWSDSTAVLTTFTAPQPGRYQLRWTEESSNCTASDTIRVEFLPPPTGVVTNFTCDATAQNYSITLNVSGGVPPYQTSNGTLNGNTLTSATFASGTSYNIVVRDRNGCASAPIVGVRSCACASRAGTMARTILRSCGTATVQAKHNGDAALDPNDRGVYVLHTRSGDTLGTVLAQNTTGIFQWNATNMRPESTYYISYVVGNRTADGIDTQDPCLAVAPGQPFQFQPFPTVQAGRDTTVCGLTLTLARPAGNGTWSAIRDATIAATGQATTATFGIRPFVWTISENGCAASDTLLVHFRESPQITTLPKATCTPTRNAYTVSFAVTGGQSPYTIQGLAGTWSNNTFTSEPLANASFYAATVTDAGGCRAAIERGTADCACSTRAGSMIDTLVNVCVGDTAIATWRQNGAVLDANDQVQFVLHDAPGNTLGKVLAISNTPAFLWNAATMTAGQRYYVSAMVGDRMGNVVDQNDPCLQVAPGQPVVFHAPPVVQAGNDTSVCGQAITLRMPPKGGLWSADGTLIFSNNNTLLTVFEYGPRQLILTVKENGCIVRDSMRVVFREPPVLTALARARCTATRTGYTLSLAVNGGQRPYTIQGTTGNWVGNTFTSNELPNASPYNLIVKDAAGCTVTAGVGSTDCSCQSRAGAMSTALLSRCVGDSVTATWLNTTAVVDTNDRVQFVLHDGAGTTLGNVLATSKRPTFLWNAANMTAGRTYYISAVVADSLGNGINNNDVCRVVAAGQPVIFQAKPTAYAGRDTAICGNQILIPHLNPTGVWTSNDRSVTLTARGNGTTEVTTSTFGRRPLYWTVTENGCSSQDTVLLNFRQNPTFQNALKADCTRAKTGYVLSFSAQNGQAPYSVQGMTGTWSGNLFTSAELANATNYRFTVSDANGCSAGIKEGTGDCSCRTQAGIMNDRLVENCVGESVSAFWAQPAVLDTNDRVQFVLHDASGPRLGKVLATSEQPFFMWNAALIQPGKTYYISAIAGDRLRTGIDANDVCLSVAAGTPVRWRIMPQVQLKGSTKVCQGDSARITLKGRGDFPLNVRYAYNGTTNTLELRDSTAVTLLLPVVQSSLFRLLLASYDMGNACPSLLRDSLSIRTSQPVTAGTALPEIKFCQSDTIIQLNQRLTGAAANGTWMADLPLANPNALNSYTGRFETKGLPPALYTFRYRVTPEAPCPVAETKVDIRLLTVPSADAGPDVPLSCQLPIARIGRVSPTTNVRYQWRSSSRLYPLSEDATLRVDTAGTYLLTVIHADGCAASDTVRVLPPSNGPEPTGIAVQGVRCFGDANGAIRVLGVRSEHPPVIYALNQVAFTQNSTFSNLKAGTYTLTLEDTKGCQWQSSPIVVKEPPPLTVTLGTDRQVNLGDSVVIMANVGRTPTQIQRLQWQPVFDSVRQKGFVQRFLPLRSSMVRLTVTDTAGCVGSAALAVHVRTARNVYAPTVFAPEGDRDNRLFRLYTDASVVRIEHFSVFDRWGAHLFTAADFSPNTNAPTWDGRYRGTLLPSGVYTWMARLRYVDGLVETVSGSITLIR